MRLTVTSDQPTQPHKVYSAVTLGDKTIQAGNSELRIDSLQLDPSTVTCPSLSCDYLLGNGSGIDVYPALSVSSIVVTDSTFVTSNSQYLPDNNANVFYAIRGTGLLPGTYVRVNGVSAYSTTYVNDSELHVQGPALPAGSYPVTVTRVADGTSREIPLALSYDPVPVWSTQASLGVVYGDFSFQLSASESGGSNVSYTFANGSSLPNATLYSNGSLQGNNSSSTTSTYVFDVVATDEEGQSALRTFSIVYSRPPTWVTPSDLGNVNYAEAFAITLQATSDSTVSYSNTSALPPETTLNSTTGSLSGNITSVANSTQFSFTVDATDLQLQKASRTFLLQYNRVLYVQSGLILHLDASSSASYPGSGTTWYDVSGNNYHGTLVNGVTYSADNGGTFNFNGSSQYINGVHNTTLDRTGDMTAEVWFRVDTNPVSDCVRFFGKGDATYRSFGLWQCSGNYFLYQRYGASGSINAGYSATVNLNQWYHMVGTSSGGNHVLYLNNVQVATASGASTFYSSTDPYKVGYGAPHTYHQGRIGAARMYNRALSAAEVATNWNASKGLYGY